MKKILLFGALLNFVLAVANAAVADGNVGNIVVAISCAIGASILFWAYKSEP